MSTQTPSVFGQSISFTATVAVNAPGAGTLTGSVQFSIDGTNFGAAVALDGSGKATSPAISTLSLGSHSITATYSGAATFLPSNGSLTQQVTYKICLLYTPATPLLHGSTVLVRLTLCDANNVNFSSQNTVLTVKGVSPTPGVPGPTGSFSYVSTLTRPGGGYQYYLNTAGYGPGSYQLLFTTPGDPVTHQAAFTLS